MKTKTDESWNEYIYINIYIYIYICVYIYILLSGTQLCHIRIKYGVREMEVR
jgi:hypothetical protein